MRRAISHLLQNFVMIGAFGTRNYEAQMMNFSVGVSECVSYSANANALRTNIFPLLWWHTGFSICRPKSFRIFQQKICIQAKRDGEREMLNSLHQTIHPFNQAKIETRIRFFFFFYINVTFLIVENECVICIRNIHFSHLSSSHSFSACIFLHCN